MRKYKRREFSTSKRRSSWCSQMLGKDEIIKNDKWFKAYIVRAAETAYGERESHSAVGFEYEKKWGNGVKGCNLQS